MNDIITPPSYEYHGTKTRFTVTLTGNKHAGSFTCITLQPGVHFAFNDIHTRYWPTQNSTETPSNLLTINICLEGRCETALSDGKYAIVSSGQLSMGTQQAQDLFFYPTDCYRGVEFFIDLDLFTAPSPANYLQLSGIHIPEMTERLSCRKRLFFRNASEEILSLTNKLWNARNTTDIGSIRLHAAMLLHLMQEIENKPENMTWFTKTQIMIVRETEKRLMQDLSVRITAKEIAGQYGISETSFKNYFKGVFGEGFLAYFRRKRMEQAADLLSQTDLKIIEISERVGYENQGKFAGAFKTHYGMTPLEYRRASHLSNASQSLSAAPLPSAPQNKDTNAAP